MTFDGNRRFLYTAGAVTLLLLLFMGVVANIDPTAGIAAGVLAVVTLYIVIPLAWAVRVREREAWLTLATSAAVLGGVALVYLAIWYILQ